MVTQAENSSVPATVDLARCWPVPAIVAAAGDKAGERFFTDFTDTIRNKNTRAAYFRNACRFMAWCEGRGLTLKTIRSFHVSAYVEALGTTHEPPSVKQHTECARGLEAAVRQGRLGAGRSELLFDETSEVAGPSLEFTSYIYVRAF
jgi:hypothetical protein